MKLICLWVGTDSWCLTEYPPGNKIWHVKLFFYRIKWRIIHKYFEHWVDHENLIQHLVKFGIKRENIKIKPDCNFLTERFEKVKHNGFNVLYYMPKNAQNLGGRKFTNFLYGWDIYVNIRAWFFDNHDIHFIWVNGDNDMASIYPTVDLYIRPTRHDGAGRMITECHINNIPVIHSRDGQPNVDYFIKEIQKEYDKYKKIYG